MAYLLLTKGADPRNLSVAQGDTAAVFIYLNNKGKAFAVENIPIPYLPVWLLQARGCTPVCLADVFCFVAVVTLTVRRGNGSSGDMWKSRKARL